MSLLILPRVLNFRFQLFNGKMDTGIEAFLFIGGERGCKVINRMELMPCPFQRYLDALSAGYSLDDRDCFNGA